MLQVESRVPRGHRQVWFLELALNFKAFTGRLLPWALQATCTGQWVSLHEKVRVLWLALHYGQDLTGRHGVAGLPYQ